ncbi:MAG: pancreas/duodenum homeobox protein 1 [Desulfobacterales bacterium SG8_35_2]|nr:MAG: pancreas/duodenum homeobox protein 1 [Desulfobacterales bacterium SG8_35_2]
MLPENVEALFTSEILSELLPPQRSDEFFEALYGDPDEGAYDIRLAFNNYDRDQKVLSFELQLHGRPEKCLACNLTYGLPEVFSRHPLININGMVKKIVALLDEEANCDSWELGRTRTPQDNLHVIPLSIQLG